ncbi:MAG: hypothetical protein RBS37_01705 [Bacteroidales bacterium]|jgi:spermidine synthase|nr:hypothetical protein [Bacteroidales bacterium]
MYHVALTGSTVLFFYLFTALLCRENFAGRMAVRKLWNFLLLITFLVTALAGIILALQISLGFEIPGLKELLKIHVETGIAFSFTAILHIIRHLRYFTGRYNTTSGGLSDVHTLPESPEILPPGNIFALGFVTSALQLLALREFLNMSGGYELIAGTYFSVWLIISAVGAYQAGGSRSASLRKINMWLFISPLITLILQMAGSRFFILPGETPGYFRILIMMLLVLLPACFISGYSFVRLSLLSPGQAGYSYAVETTGGIAAGLTVAIITSGIAGTFTLWLLLSISSLMYLLFFDNQGKRKRAFRSTATGIFIIASLTIILIPVDTLLRNNLIRGITIIKSTDTRFGNIALGDYAGERTIYYNHSIAVYEHDIKDREEGVHLAMLQHPSPEKVLVISGSLRSMLPEIDRYDRVEVTFIERDPELIEAYSGAVPRTSDILTEILHEDAFRYIRSTGSRFDIVLMHLPPPSSLALSRYYTTEFFSGVKQILNIDGVLACSPGFSSTYLNDEVLDLYGSVYQTLKLSFRNVLPVAGDRLWLLASDSRLSTDFAALAMDRKITTAYIGGGYVSDDLTAGQSERIREVLPGRGKTNTLERPVAGLYYQKYVLSRHNVSSLLPVLVLAAMIIISLVRGGRKGIAMFSVAAALSGFEMTLLLLLQSTAGNMYYATGIITSSFLGGLAGGSWHARSMSRLSGNRSSAIMLTVFYLLSGAAIPLLIRVESILITPLLACLSLVPSYFTGRFYAIAAEERNRNGTLPVIYGADLTGAALGFLFTSILTVPLLGMRMSVLILAMIVFAGYSLGTVLNK